MEATLKSVTYRMMVNGERYYICHCLVWKKEYAEGVAFWQTTINGATMIGKSGYTFSYRKTMPTKAEMRKHIENNWYPKIDYPTYFDVQYKMYGDKKQIWYNPTFSRETIKSYEK